MIKKILKWCVILTFLSVILIGTGCYVFVHWFAKDMMESQLEKVVHRDVEINQLALNIFSTAPEIVIKDLVIANQRLTDTSKANETNIIAEKDRFVDIKAMQCMLKLMPLLDGQIELSELLVKEPHIKIIRHPNGTFNFSDLVEPPEKKKTAPPKTTPAQPPQPDKKIAKNSEPKKEDKAESKVFSADDLPFHILIGKIGIENAHIQFLDEKYHQAIHLNKMKLLLHDANINPKNLEKENIIKVDISMNIKSEGELKSGWTKTFDVDVLLEAAIQPFNIISRLLDPQAIIKTGSPSGVISGLQLYESIRSILMNYEIKALDILKEDLRWKTVWFN